MNLQRPFCLSQFAPSAVQSCASGEEGQIVTMLSLDVLDGILGGSDRSNWAECVGAASRNEKRLSAVRIL